MAFVSYPDEISEGVCQSDICYMSMFVWRAHAYLCVLLALQSYLLMERAKQGYCMLFFFSLPCEYRDFEQNEAANEPQPMWMESKIDFVDQIHYYYIICCRLNKVFNVYSEHERK